MNLRAVWLIGRSVLIEAVRRREIYAIVLISTLIIAMVMTLDFFQLSGLSKFYREIALKVMGTATAITVIVLATRQLPREFENRTIYPLLAKPVSRFNFLLGKLAGVMMAAAFCFGLFMTVYYFGAWHMGDRVPWGLFLQYIYLQMLSMLVLATLGFWISLLLNLDAALTMGVLFFITASTLTSMTTFLYEFLGAAQRVILVGLVYLVPQLTLFDLSEKAIHSELWKPLSGATLLALTAYALVFSVFYFACAIFCFRRRAL